MVPTPDEIRFLDSFAAAPIRPITNANTSDKTASLTVCHVPERISGP